MTDVDTLRTDFGSLRNGERIKLFPLPNNPLHKKPIIGTVIDGYVWCDGTDATEGPDYYWGDVLQYNEGFEVVP